MDLSQEDVIEIIRLLNESHFEELSLEMGGLKLVLSRHSPRGCVHESTVRSSDLSVPHDCEAFSIPQRAPEFDAVEPAQRERSDERVETATLQEDGLTPIRSPMLGTFYRAPKPEDPPFVEVGKAVSEDDTLCIIEVMKLFSAIKAGIRGRVSKICAENGQMVEYNQVLFLIEPESH